MCVLTTHIGFRCIWCVVIVLHLSSWSDDPHLLLSSFNPYLSDPLPLLSLIHFSHDVVLPLFSLSHDTIIVLLMLEAESLLRYGHSSHVTYSGYYICVDSVAGCSLALLSREILYPSQVSVPVKDKLEFLGRSLANNPLSSCSDSSLFICNYSGVSGLEYLSSSSKDLQFRGTHHDLSRSSSA